jgi:hypothetical protein
LHCCANYLHWLKQGALKKRDHRDKRHQLCDLGLGCCYGVFLGLFKKKIAISCRDFFATQSVPAFCRGRWGGIQLK